MQVKKFDVLDEHFEGGGDIEMQEDIYKVGKDGTVNKSRREQTF